MNSHSAVRLWNSLTTDLVGILDSDVQGEPTKFGAVLISHDCAPILLTEDESAGSDRPATRDRAAADRRCAAAFLHNFANAIAASPEDPQTQPIIKLWEIYGRAREAVRMLQPFTDRLRVQNPSDLGAAVVATVDQLVEGFGKLPLYKHDDTKLDLRWGDPLGILSAAQELHDAAQWHDGGGFYVTRGMIEDLGRRIYGSDEEAAEARRRQASRNREGSMPVLANLALREDAQAVLNFMRGNAPLSHTVSAVAYLVFNGQEEEHVDRAADAMKHLREIGATVRGENGRWQIVPGTGHINAMPAHPTPTLQVLQPSGEPDDDLGGVEIVEPTEEERRRL